MKVGQFLLITPHEFDKDNIEGAVDPTNLSYSLDNPQVATIAVQDGGVLKVTAVGPGTATIGCSDTKFSLTADPVVITVDGITPPPVFVPTKLTLVAGDPVDQPATAQSVAGGTAQKVA